MDKIPGVRRGGGRFCTRPRFTLEIEPLETVVHSIELAMTAGGSVPNDFVITGRPAA
ncbi:MAG: hypothetical protein J7M24_06315 [Candidatus Latescibacteria bacterium]|nr:hypothetical protein [Candidatus Latescibacterota bacterium]